MTDRSQDEINALAAERIVASIYASVESLVDRISSSVHMGGDLLPESDLRDLLGAARTMKSQVRYISTKTTQRRRAAQRRVGGL